VILGLARLPGQLLQAAAQPGQALAQDRRSPPRPPEQGFLEPGCLSSLLSRTKTSPKPYSLSGRRLIERIQRARCCIATSRGCEPAVARFLAAFLCTRVQQPWPRSASWWSVGPGPARCANGFAVFTPPEPPAPIPARPMLPPNPPDSCLSELPWPGLDPPGIVQALGGLILGLIALLSSYDHIAIPGRNLPLPQQWGIPCIAASVATVALDAQLASRSRLRAADAAARAAHERTRERHRAARSLSSQPTTIADLS
jgi:hypothetical protein